MKSMNMKLIAMSAVTSLILVGCGGGSSTTPVNTTAPVSTTTVSGTAIDPEIQGANVYLDANGNGQYDVGELNTTTDKFGKYTLDIPEADIGKQIIVEGGVDRVTKEDFIGKLRVAAKAINSGQFVTPLTTLVEQYKTSNPDKTETEVKSEVATKLGLANVDDLDKNILEDTALLKAALRVNKVAQRVASASGQKLDDVYKKIAKNLTDKDFETAMQDTIDADVNKTSLDYDKLVDLAKELKNLDHATLNAEEFALTVDNIDRNITASKTRAELNDDLFDDERIRISDATEVKDFKSRKALEKLGFKDLDEAVKKRIIENKEINFNDDLLSELKDKIENNKVGIDTQDMQKVDREKLFNASSIKDLSSEDRGKLKEKFDSEGFDFSKADKTALEAKLKDAQFLQGFSDKVRKEIEGKTKELAGKTKEFADKKLEIAAKIKELADTTTTPDATTSTDTTTETVDTTPDATTSTDTTTETVDTTPDATTSTDTTTI